MFGRRLFVCPQCGQETLWIHLQTYEELVQAFCNNCHLNISFKPSKEACHDSTKTWEELKANYDKTHPKTEAMVRSMAKGIKRELTYKKQTCVKRVLLCVNKKMGVAVRSLHLLYCSIDEISKPSAANYTGGNHFGTAHYQQNPKDTSEHQ